MSWIRWEEDDDTISGPNWRKMRGYIYLVGHLGGSVIRTPSSTFAFDDNDDIYKVISNFYLIGLE